MCILWCWTSLLTSSNLYRRWLTTHDAVHRDVSDRYCKIKIFPPVSLKTQSTAHSWPFSEFRVEIFSQNVERYPERKSCSNIGVTRVSTERNVLTRYMVSFSLFFRATISRIILKSQKKAPWTKTNTLWKLRKALRAVFIYRFRSDQPEFGHNASKRPNICTAQL